MFSLSHGFTNKWTDPALYTYLIELAVTILSYWVHLPTIRAVGLLLLFIGYGFFALDMKEILAKRVKKKLDKPFSFSITAIWNGLILHFIALLAALFNLNSENVWGWIIYLYMMTWIIFSMLSYLYKIVPFLVWTHKYSEMVGKEKVPTLKEMMNEKLGAILYRLFTISIFGIIVSVAFSSGIALFIFLGIQALASIIFAITIMRVLLK